ncbi:hypothetical protein GAY31_08100 [Azospirillum brasilense]|nr:hypothetical protein [Azospirillum brasilense]
MSILVRLLLLVLLAIAPISAIEVWNQLEQRRNREAEIHNTALHLLVSPGGQFGMSFDTGLCRPSPIGSRQVPRPRSNASDGSKRASLTTFGAHPRILPDRHNGHHHGGGVPTLPIAISPPRLRSIHTQRQYDEVEPENRLVARTLERRWEVALQAETHVKEEYARFLARQPAQLTAAERTAIERLAADVSAIWRASSTTAAERKEIVRLVLERVVVVVEGETEHMAVECHWAGGRRTRHRLRRAVRRMTQLAGHDELFARTTALFAEGLRPPAIARTLAAEGWLSPHGQPVTEGGVRSWLQRRGCCRMAGTAQPWWCSGSRTSSRWRNCRSASTSPRARFTGGFTRGWFLRAGRQR